MAVSGIGATPAASAATTAKAKSALDKDTFLKVMVAQLQHQDPTSPQDSGQYMAQMAQFTTVEQLTNIAASTEDGVRAGTINQALALVGRNVSYSTKDGVSTGVVDRAVFGKDGTTVTVGGVDGIALSSIAQVQAPAGPTTSTTGGSAA